MTVKNLNDIVELYFLGGDLKEILRVAKLDRKQNNTRYLIDKVFAKW